MRSCTTQLLRQRSDYCCTILLDATVDQKARLQVLQNSCIRFIFGLRRDVHITPYRERLNWMRTDTRRIYFTGILLYKLFNFRKPFYLLNLFNARQSERPAKEVTGDLATAQVNSEFGIRSFRSRGVHLWNSLQKKIKYLPSLSRFKSAFRAHLLAPD